MDRIGRAPRVALGCMRLSTDADRDEARAEATLSAAWDAGVRLFDTARAYGLDHSERGHNERLVAQLPADAFIVTKGGMRRDGGPRGWRPDGRAKQLRADAEASAEALGRPLDLWLLHAPDPTVPFATSLRAMRAILADGTASAVGLSNVHREQVRQARETVEIAAVQVALSPFDDEALLDGLVASCADHGIWFFAHSPLGGPKRAPRLRRRKPLATHAAAAGLSPAQASLAWLQSLGTHVIPVVGARRPTTAQAMVFESPPQAILHALRALQPASRWAQPLSPPPLREQGEVVLLMGVAGAGKSRHARSFVEEGYTRLNRDTLGGTLRGIVQRLDRALDDGVTRAVLDNTYLTRSQRARVIMVAWQHGLPVRCRHVDTPEGAAQVNLVQRLVDELGALPGPDELRTSKLPGVLPPLRHHRMVAQLVPPLLDEGFTEVSTVRFAREPAGGVPGRVVPLEAASLEASSPTLAIGWRPDGGPLPEAAPGVEVAVCRHASGAPRCWCRPPLPGLVVAWTRRAGIDPTRLHFVGGGPSHERLAAAFEAPFECDGGA